MSLRHFLARQVDGSSLGLFRILWGLLMVWESIRKLPKASGMYSPEYFHFTYSLFPFVKPLPEVWMMQVEISIMLIAAVLVTVGWWFRPASAVFLAVFTHLFLIEKLYYNNHFYLTILMGILLMVSEAHRCYRLPTLKEWRAGLKREVVTVPFWNLAMMRGQIIVLYFFGGIAKLNSDWLAGEPVRFWFRHKDPNHFLSPLIGQEWFIWMVCWSGLLLDLFAGFALLSKRTRLFTMILLIVFHSTNSQLFQIGLFPLIGIGLLILFVDPDRPRKVFHWIGQKAGWIAGSVSVPVANRTQTAHVATWSVTVFCCGWMAFQVFFPMRILAYKDNPSWTEVGHCFSWRMMLRTKDAFIQYKFDPPEAERYLEQHPDALPKISQAHVNQMVKNPHFILQYAHAVSAALEREGIKGVKIHAVSVVSLNGRPYQLMIDPETDLATASYGFFEVPDWIVPLDKYRKPGQYPESPQERAKIIADVYQDYLQERQPQVAPAPLQVPSRPKYAALDDYSGTVH